MIQNNGDLAAGCTIEALRHDARQPLATLRVMIDAARHRPAAPDPLLFDRIHDQVEYLEAILAGADGTARRRTVDLGAVAARAATDAATRFARRVDLEAHPVHVAGDATALRRAALNLLTNACQAAHDAAHIRVTTGTRQGRAFVDVADSGPGLGARPPGLGIGIVQAIARDHGGDLHLLSSERGTIATLELPQVPRGAA